MLSYNEVKKVDKEVYDAIIAEWDRQQNGLELIASENRPSLAVLEAQSSRTYFKIRRRIPTGKDIMQDVKT